MSVLPFATAFKACYPITQEYHTARTAIDIRVRRDPKLNTLAKTQLAWRYGRSYHVILHQQDRPDIYTTAHEFEQQINALHPFLASHWTVRSSPATGNPLYERPIVLVIHREDYKFLLHDVIPRPGKVRADYDLVIASQPYRLRVPAAFKAQKVLGPLARALGPGGRLIGIHSSGGDPGIELIQRVWPGENPFQTDRHSLLRALKAELGNAGRNLNFNAYSDARSVFRYDMHTLPSEVGSSIGTSTLFAAWNAAVYVAQIDDERLAQVLGKPHYLEATAEVLKKHGSLWFLDESYVVSRKRDAR